MDQIKELSGELESMKAKAAKEAMGDQALKQVSLLGCVALKTAMANEAQACFDELLAVEEGKVSAEGYLTCVKNMLMMAARMRKGELFTEWLKEAEEKLSLTLNQVEQDKAVDFIIALTFIVCDRRYVDSLAVVRNLANQVITSIQDKKLLQALFNEWTSLIAQMARRNWSEGNSFLLTVLLKALLKKRVKFSAGPVPVCLICFSDKKDTGLTFFFKLLLLIIEALFHSLQLCHTPSFTSVNVKRPTASLPQLRK